MVEVRKNVLNVMVKEDVVDAMARELSGAHLVKAVALIGVINVMELVL